MKKGTVAVVGTILGVVIGGVGSISLLKKGSINKKSEKIDKFKNYYNMLNHWLMIKQQNKSLEQYFSDRGYKSIAIYGMGEMGVRLYEELKDTSIDIKFAIDKNGSCKVYELQTYNVDECDFNNKIDAIVVTATFAYNDILKELSDKVKCPIISLEEVIYER